MPHTPQNHIVISPEVARAIKAQIPIVALESTVITHGLPKPQNISLAHDMEHEVRKEGCVPATIAALDGRIRIGISSEEINRLANCETVMKISRRDLSEAVAKKRTGGTTVSATMTVANHVGIKVFATGGIGGVHPGSPFDISADLRTLADTPLLVVCAGAKAILDLMATMEYLETMSVPVVGYQTDELPAFYSAESGHKVNIRLDSPAEIVRYAKVHWELGLTSGILIAQPPPEASDLPMEKVADYIHQTELEATRLNIKGQALTPFQLKRLSELSSGATVKTNIDLLLNNARLAARISKAFQHETRGRVI